MSADDNDNDGIEIEVSSTETESKPERAFTVKATGTHASRVPQLLEMLVGTGNWHKVDDTTFSIPATVNSQSKMPLLAQATSRLEGVSLSDPDGGTVQAGTGVGLQQPTGAQPAAPHVLPGNMPPQAAPQPLTLEQKTRRNLLRARGRYGRKLARVNFRPLGTGGPQYVIRWGRVDGARCWTVDINLNSLADGERGPSSERIGYARGFKRQQGYYRAIDIAAAHIHEKIMEGHGMIVATPDDPTPWERPPAGGSHLALVDGDEDDEPDVHFEITDASTSPDLALLTRTDEEEEEEEEEEEVEQPVLGRPMRGTPWKPGDPLPYKKPVGPKGKSKRQKDKERKIGRTAEGKKTNTANWRARRRVFSTWPYNYVRGLTGKLPKNFKPQQRDMKAAVAALLAWEKAGFGPAVPPPPKPTKETKPKRKPKAKRSQAKKSTPPAE